MATIPASSSHYSRPPRPSRRYIVSGEFDTVRLGRRKIRIKAYFIA